MENKIIYRAGTTGPRSFDIAIGKKFIGFEIDKYVDIYFVQGKEAAVIKPHRKEFDCLIGMFKDGDKRNVHVSSVVHRKGTYIFHLNDERFKTVVGDAEEYIILIDNEHKAIIIKYGR